MTTARPGERTRLAVYLVSFLVHAGLWQGVRSLEAPAPPPPPPVKITIRDVPPEQPPEPPPPEPEAAEPEAAPVEAPPTPAPPKPEPTPAKPKKQKPAPEPTTPPADAAPPDFGVQLQGGSGPGGASVPAGDPGGSAAPAPRERSETKSRKLDAKPKKPPADACSDPEVRPTPLEIPQPPYSDAARAAGVEGKVRVQLAITADGSVSGVKIVTPLHPDLDEAARVAMKSARFTPASRCGQPIATSLTLSVKFTL